MPTTTAPVRIDRHRCLGAGTCVLLAPTAFGWYRNELHKATLLDPTSIDQDLMREVAYACPTQAIILDEEEAAANEVLGRMGGASAAVAERWSDGGRRSVIDTGDGGSEPAAARRMRTFMFTDIVGSTNLIEAIGDDAWAGVLRWHDETLRRLFSGTGTVLNHTGDGFFVAFDEAATAVGTAVVIQRTLAGHRREHGFAPQVRIGLHCAPATTAAPVTSGRDVHVAARIAAVAQGGEILASRDVLSGGAVGFDVSTPRTVELKGIATPVEVVTIGWR